MYSKTPGLVRYRGRTMSIDQLANYFAVDLFENMDYQANKSEIAKIERIIRQILIKKYTH